MFCKHPNPMPNVGDKQNLGGELWIGFVHLCWPFVGNVHRRWVGVDLAMRLRPVSTASMLVGRHFGSNLVKIEFVLDCFKIELYHPK
jgi:hypothetical protein